MRREPCEVAASVRNCEAPLMHEIARLVVNCAHLHADTAHCGVTLRGERMGHASGDFWPPICAFYEPVCQTPVSCDAGLLLLSTRTADKLPS